MDKNFLLKTKGAKQLYEKYAKNLPIIDFHNHINVNDYQKDKKFTSLTEVWVQADPYKHRLMRICGVDEHFITGNATPFEKFEKFCEIFPMLAGNPVYDWSRMELKFVFGIEEQINSKNAKIIYEKANALLSKPEFSHNGILSKFNIEYQSPVATITDSLQGFSKNVAPSLRADDLLSPTDELKEKLQAQTGVEITDKESYLKAVCVNLNKFNDAGCKFADHALDAGFFEQENASEKADMLIKLGVEYAKLGWTLLLHIDAKRATSSRLRELAGPAGGYAAVGGDFNITAVCDLLGQMEKNGGLPDTIIFPLNLSDQAPLAVMQGSFSQDGVASKVQLGPAWWWCDHQMGITNTLKSIANFGVLAEFIGMTTDSRSVLSFIRHDYFRRMLCSWIDEQNRELEWDLSLAQQGEIVKKICYQNAKAKIN